MQYLKQSTTTTIQLGPFLDSTDGVTAETGLTIEDTDVYLSKAGAAFANPNDTNNATHDRAGWYRKQLNTTDTNTLGRFIVEVQESGALPVWREFMILPANVYDSLVGGTDSLEVDATAISGDSTAADNLELDYDGTGYAKANSTIGTTTTNTDMVAAAPTAAAVRTEIDSNSTQLAAIVADTNELQTDWTNGGRLDLILDDILADTNELQTDWVNGGRLDLIVDAILTDTNELQTDWTNGGRLDLIIDAILADTGTDGVVISTTTAQAIADEILIRGVSNTEDTADTTSLTAIILAILESSISSTTWTIRKTGGTTFATKTVTLDSGADPITAVT